MESGALRCREAWQQACRLRTWEKLQPTRLPQQVSASSRNFLDLSGFRSRRSEFSSECSNASTIYASTCAKRYGLGLGSGVGRALGVGLGRGVGVGRGVDVGVAIGVAVAVGVGVGVAVTVGVGVGPPDGKTRTK